MNTEKKIDRYLIKEGGMMSSGVSPKNAQRIKKILPRAKDAFWKVIAKEFKEAMYGDVDPMMEFAFDKATQDSVENWVRFNVEPPE